MAYWMRRGKLAVGVATGAVQVGWGGLGGPFPRHRYWRALTSSTKLTSPERKPYRILGPLTNLMSITRLTQPTSSRRSYIIHSWRMPEAKESLVAYQAVSYHVDPAPGGRALLYKRNNVGMPRVSPCAEPLYYNLNQIELLGSFEAGTFC